MSRHILEIVLVVNKVRMQLILNMTKSSIENYYNYY